MKETIKYVILHLIWIVIAFSGGIIYQNNRHECPSVTNTDTLYVYDTITHIIVTPPEIIKDTIFYPDTIPFPVDTLAILRDYYAFHSYTRRWIDDDMDITVKDVLTQNSFFETQLSYKILRPQSIIINNEYITNYNRAIYTGLTFNSKFTTIDVLYADNRLALGLGYSPFTRSLSVKAYVNIINLK